MTPIWIALSILMVNAPVAVAAPASLEPHSVLADELGYSVFLAAEELKALRADPASAGLVPKEVADQAVRKLGIPAHEYRFQATSDHTVTDQSGQTELLEQTFLYRRLIRRIPVYGPGSYIAVTVGNSGELKLVEVSWPKLSLAGSSGELLAHPVVTDPEHIPVPDHSSRGFKTEGFRNMGIRYLNRPLPDGGLETVPVLLVAKDAGRPLEGPDEVFEFLPLRSSQNE